MHWEAWRAVERDGGAENTSPRWGEVGGASPPGEGPLSGATTSNPTELHQNSAPGAISPFPRFIWFFVAVALLALPIFAHGCHGDDVDHEPFLVPFRLNSEDR